MVDSKQADEIIEFLNELLALDAYAIAMALTVRVPCNKALSDHPTVQSAKAPDSGRREVSALGILNGLCGVFGEGSMKNMGPIGAIVENGRLVRFQRTDTPPVPGRGLQRIGVTV